MIEPHDAPETKIDSGSWSPRGPQAEPSDGPSMVWVIVVVAIVLAFVILHLTGVIGPGVHS